MGDGSLSQDEIDALLKGADEVAAPSSVPAMEVSPIAGALSPLERDALADIINQSMNAVAPSLGAYLGKNVRISNAYVEVKTLNAIRADFNRQYVQVSMDFTGALRGRNTILFGMNEAGIIASLMMGDDTGTPPPELSEAHQSTLQEFVSQMLSSCATQFADRKGGMVGTTAPNISISTNSSELQLPTSNEVVKITYNINVENLINSKFYHLMDINIASELVRAAPMGGMGMQAHFTPQPQMTAPQMGAVGVSPVKFPPLGEGVPTNLGPNINLLLDVRLTLTVELGRTTMLVKDILGLGEGSIIELDKLAGEPVDLLVNGKLIARGEVVVIDENFGVRVTDIVSPAERVERVQ